MESYKTVELTITPNYVSDWSFSDAIRELIQNGVDQQTLNPENEFDISYNESENVLQLSNSKSTLEINTLLLGCSTKTNNTDTVGQFGEGYKIAALVLNRIGKTFTVYNNNKNEIWISKFEYSETFGEEILMFKIYNHPTEEKGLIIEIENVEESEFDSLYDVWLNMPGSIDHKKIVTSYGEIFTEEDMCGKVFVNGLAVECNSNKYFGYNFKPKYIKLERDRKSCNSWDMSKITGDMICEAMNAGEISAKDIFEIAENYSFNDISYLQYKTWDEGVKKATQMFVAEFDDKYHDSIPVNTQSEFDRIKKIGGKPVIVPYYIASVMSEETENRIEKLESTAWTENLSTKEKLLQWRDIYEDNFTNEAIQIFNQIVEELE